MRALVLLLLCVVLLAVLQASYIVTEAKKHNEMRMADDADRESKHEKKMRRKGKNGGKDSSDLEITDVVSGLQVNDLAKADPDMPSDQPESERSGRRERVSKEERQARKEERQNRKEERQERKEQRMAAKAERQAKKGNKRERNERKQEKAEKKAERQAGKKNNRQQRKEERQQQVSCASDVDCGDGACCVPKRGGEMFCKANRKPRKAGKKCITSCTCEGDLACYAENPAPDAPARPRNRQLGKCVASSEADLTRGTILAAAPQEAIPGA